MDWTYLIIFFIIVIIIGVVTVVWGWPAANRYYEKTLTDNHDSFELEFCYRVPKTKREIIECLKVHSQYDILNYEFNEETSEITFMDSEPRVWGPFRFMMVVKEEKGFCILKIVQITGLFGTNAYSRWRHKLNPFWQKKIGAEPIPYFK